MLEQVNLNRNQLQFNNNKVQSLYDCVHSQRVSQMIRADDIYNTLHNLIEAVISDPGAMAEAETWNEFSSVIEHQNGQHHFRHMNFYVSRAVSLWMCVYH